MKASQIGNTYLLELASAAMPHRPDMWETLKPDLLDPALARGARSFIMGCMVQLGYTPCLMAYEAARIARKAMRQPEPLAWALAKARANPLALSDAEAALRACGLGVDEARKVAATDKGREAARAIRRGWYKKADSLLASA